MPVHDPELPVTLPVTLPVNAPVTILLLSVTPPILFDEAVGVIKLLDRVVLVLLTIPPTLRVVPFHVNPAFAFTLVALTPVVITWSVTLYPFTASAP